MGGASPDTRSPLPTAPPDTRYSLMQHMACSVENTGALDKKNLAIYSTSGSDSLVSATDRDVEQTDGSTADVDRDDQEKTSISIDGDAGTTISTKLAEVTNSGETTKQVMQVLGGILDCGAAIAGAIVSGGVGTGGAVAACGKLVAGGAPLTPYMPSPARPPQN